MYTRRTILLVALGVIVLVLIVLSYTLYVGDAWPFSIPRTFSLENTSLEFTDTGVPVWYKISFGRLVPGMNPTKLQGKPAFTILEAVPFYNQGDTAVLASVPNQSGVVLGVLHKNGVFESILADGTYKTDLAVRSDGMALFASSSSTLPAAIALTSAKAQASTIFANPHTESSSDLILVNLVNKNHPTQDLGSGRSPRIEQDGSFIALTPAGLLSLNPGTAAPRVIVASPDANGTGAAISKDGSVVALPDSFGIDTFYSVRSTGVQVVLVLGKLPLGFVDAAAFLDDQHFVTVVSAKSGSYAFINAVPNGSVVKNLNNVRLPIVSGAFPN